MDRARFDALTRLFATTPTRRVALGALLGAGVTSLTGALGTSTALKKKGSGKGSGKGKGKAKKGRVAGQVSSEAVDCLSIGPSSNMSGCNFNNEDLAGMDLSSSRMVGTRFRGANLCRADLSSSNLKNADFRGFAAPGNATNLTLADLSSSGCGGVLTNSRTIFCQTKTCTGALRSDPGCPEHPCCSNADCDPDETCVEGACQCPGCISGTCQAGNRWNQCGSGGETCEACLSGSVCAADSHTCEACASQSGLTACDGWVSPAGPTPGAQCGPPLCACAERAVGGGSFCWGSPVHCNVPGVPCTTVEGACPTGLVCVRKGSCPLLDQCPGETVCVPACQASTPSETGIVEVILPA